MTITAEEYSRPFPQPVYDYAHWFSDRHYPPLGTYPLWETMTWRGHSVLKTPSDMWVYQELLTKIRPRRIIELGTHQGGTALYYADILELLGVFGGRVITVDIQERPDRPTHPRLTYVLGDTISKDVVATVRSICGDVGPVLVVLDSHHCYEQVAGELAAYHDLVTEGSYLCVEDGGLMYGTTDELSGVCVATLEFLNAHPEFEIDWGDVERFGHTTLHGGWLRRKETTC